MPCAELRIKGYEPHTAVVHALCASLKSESDCCVWYYCQVVLPVARCTTITVKVILLVCHWIVTFRASEVCYIANPANSWGSGTSVSLPAISPAGDAALYGAMSKNQTLRIA